MTRSPPSLPVVQTQQRSVAQRAFVFSATEAFASILGPKPDRPHPDLPALNMDDSLDGILDHPQEMRHRPVAKCGSPRS